jgi:hypothetical protein
MDNFYYLFDDMVEQDEKTIETLHLNYGVSMETLCDMFTAK